MPFRSNRPARLGKLRSDDSSDSPTPPPKLFDDNEETNPRSPLRESVQALTHKQIVSKRLLLREDSSSSADSGDMRNRLSRSRSSPAIEHNVDAKTSPSNVSNIVSNIESRIDIEQAINLLQELKNSASPEELVALHRALLPTKETSPTPSPTLPSIEEHAYTSIPPARKRSVIPPGLATRSGISEDVLRRQHEHSAPSRKAVPIQRKSQSFDVSKAQSINDSPSRPFTPSSQQIHAGAFQHGSLRITNGAASPEPSIISRLAIEADDAQTRSIFDLDLNDSVQNLEVVELSPQPSTTAPRPTGPRPGSTVVNSKSESKEQLRLDPPLQRHSLQPPKSRYSTSEEQPRFQQRIGHRATHLSQQYLSDCDITASPYEEKNGLLEFAKRLSRVEDEDKGADRTERQASLARSDTLSRLTGEYERDVPTPEAGHATQLSSNEAIPSIETSNDHIVRKKDSGYCSDVPASESPLQHKSSSETAELDAPPVPPHRIQSSERMRKHEPSNDNGSLYTFEEFVGCSPRSDVVPTHEATPSPASTPKKSALSLFKSRSKKSGSFDASIMDCKSESNEALSRDSSPQTVSGEGEKQKRKLQKAMPESVRRQRKKTMENLKAAQEQAASGKDRPSHTVSSEVSKPPTSPARTEFRLVPQSNDTPAEGLPDHLLNRNNEKAQDRPAKKRSKSFSRMRGKSISAPKSESLPQSSLPTRSRSKSVADAPIPVHASDDATSTANCLPARSTRTASRRSSAGSIHTDFNSVARALSSHPPTRENSVQVATLPRRPKQTRYYSQVFDGSQVAAKVAEEGNKENSVPNHDEDVAPEDLPTDPMASATARPPQPQRSATAPPSQTPVAVGSSLSVEDRFPGWQGKPAAAVASNTLSWAPPSSLPMRPSRSRNTLADTVPPLPELPADIETKVIKADQMVAKKLKLSPRSSPNSSARNSIDTTEQKQTAARKEKNAQRAKEARQAALDQLETPSEEPELKVEAGRGEGQRWSMDGSIQLPRPEDQAQSASPTHDSQHPGWPSWEQQSTLWRQRRQALALEFGHAQEEQPSTDVAKSPVAPEIKFSRYITPLGAHQIRTTTSTEHIDDAERLAQSYSNLLISDEIVHAQAPDMRRADSVVSTATFMTMSSDNRPARVDVSRTGSAISTYSTVTTTTATSWSDYSTSSVPIPTQHQRTKSGNVRPYRPADAIQAERSRALSLAKRRCGDASQESLAAPERPQHHRNRSTESLYDRYSGGLNYGWNKDDGGFGGSAGTVVEQSRRKGGKVSQDLGLDLSDIPVFLQRNSFNRA